MIENTRRSLTYCATLIFIGLLIGLGLTEIAVRAYIRIAKVPVHKISREWVETEQSPFRFDDELGWSLKANYHRPPSIITDKYALRNSLPFELNEEFYKKERVLLMGDSMVFGFNEHQTDIFSELLNKSQDKTFYINAGVDSYCTGQEYLALKKRLAQFKPSTVMLFYTQVNDMWQNPWTYNYNPGFSLDGDKLVSHAPSRYSNAPFYTYSAIHHFLDWKFLKGKDLHYVANKFDFRTRKENSYVWRLAARLLTEIAKETKAAGANLVIVDLRTPTPKDRRYETRNALLKDLALQLGVTYHDILNYYPVDTSGFFSDEIHWTPKGHRFVAQLVPKLLQEPDLQLIAQDIEVE